MVAITRGTRGIVPSAGERLQASDVLAVAGSHDVVESAVALLRRGAPRPQSAEEPLAAARNPPANEGTT